MDRIIAELNTIGGAGAACLADRGGPSFRSATASFIAQAHGVLRGDVAWR